jgi:ribonucleotide monophosphatase NagD (HAD superfamily)
MAVGGVLFDIDGVLVTSWQPIPGAAQTLRVLAEHRVACSYLTNTTTRTRAQVAEALSAAGIGVRPDAINVSSALVGNVPDENA